MKYNCVIFLYLTLISLHIVYGTLSKSDKKKKAKKTNVVVEPTPSVLPHFDWNLVSEKLVADDIIQNHNVQSHSNATKMFPSTTLGYVTPWNNLGYDIAKWYGPKFNLISPVWLQVKRKSNGEFVITGGHDIDANWVKAVRASNDKVKIVPRLFFEGWTSNDYASLFSSEYVTNACSSTIINFIKNHSFDGVVVEVWSQLGGHKTDELIHFLNHMGEDLKQSNKLLILVIPPPVYNDQIGLFSKANFDNLRKNVDFFSLMTYDFPNRRPGANSPIKWIRRCVETVVPSGSDTEGRQKILLGLNFYGYKYLHGRAEPVVGSWLLNEMRMNKPKIQWEDETAEHFFTFTPNSQDHHSVYYPTLFSIEQRLKLAQELGTGISIWEIGQGMNYFYNII